METLMPWSSSQFGIALYDGRILYALCRFCGSILEETNDEIEDGDPDDYAVCSCCETYFPVPTLNDEDGSPLGSASPFIGVSAHHPGREAVLSRWVSCWLGKDAKVTLS